MQSTLPPDPDRINEDRAEWAGAALRHFQGTTGSDFEDALCDLLCDLIHWSDRNALDFDSELSRARQHYEAETTQAPSSPTKADVHKYRVLYLVAREEYYDIEAANAQEAEDRAFSDGDLGETGETTSVECVEIERVGVRRRGATIPKRTVNGGRQ